ncbi:hypothetical protein ACUXV3_16590 [Roseobacteraceae bacterium NS-SX3]
MVESCQAQEKYIFDQDPWKYTHSSTYRAPTKQCSLDWPVFAECDGVRADACEAASDLETAKTHCFYFFTENPEGLSQEAVDIINSLRSEGGGAHALSEELTGHAIEGVNSTAGTAAGSLDSAISESTEDDLFWDSSGSEEVRSNTARSSRRNGASCMQHCLANGDFLSSQDPQLTCSNCCDIVANGGLGSCAGWKP